ncbi:MAG: 1-phosphofructokinase family hexose kinase [Armatimonadetes bacterium]|nr:1-phosphofructokinase family hexose kinase [Armatimonadota bacterium]
MILTVTLNPCLDQQLFVEKLLVGDTNRVVSTQADAGGKGVNLSRVAGALGAQTTAIGFLGGSIASRYQSLLTDACITLKMTTISGETRTNYSIETNDGTPPTTFNSSGPMISEEEWSALKSSLTALAAKAKWVCLCGSVPPGIDKGAYAELGKIARSAGAKLLIDADGEVLTKGMTAVPDMIKPNRHEAERLLGRELNSESDLSAAILELESKLAPGGIALISLGDDGAICCFEGKIYRGYSPDIEPVSSIGAGDSMLGGFLAALTRGLSVPDSLQWGLAAGAATATTDGSRIGSASTIELLFDDARVEQVN